MEITTNWNGSRTPTVQRYHAILRNSGHLHCFRRVRVSGHCVLRNQDRLHNGIVFGICGTQPAFQVRPGHAGTGRLYPYGQNTRAMWRLADPDGACAGGYHELSVMRDRFHWARLLAFVTGLVNQELLLRNEYLVAENRILRAHLPARLRLSDAERSTLAE